MALTKSQIHHNVEIIKQILKEDALGHNESGHIVFFHKNGLYIELPDSHYPKEWIVYAIKDLMKEGKTVYILAVMQILENLIQAIITQQVSIE